ncbi:MAG: hypothetical protein ACTSRL_03735 [Candidatus Helarchaeota archaeon]
MDQKLQKIQHILNKSIQEFGFFGSIIASQEGLIIFNSNQMDPKIEIEILAAKAAAIFNEQEMVMENPENITICYPKKKIFIQKISVFNGTVNNLLLIVLMPANMRYFRRKVNKIANKLKIIAFQPNYVSESIGMEQEKQLVKPAP